MPIYPAREEPIQGITSAALLDKVHAKIKLLLPANQVLAYLQNIDDCVLLTIGAGDIDRLVPEIKKLKCAL